MKTLMIFSAALAALAACSTDTHLLEPDNGPLYVSPEGHRRAAFDRGVDPVCGAKMNRAEMFWHSDHDGTVYYFDTPHCRDLFEDAPDAFIISAH